MNTDEFPPLEEQLISRKDRMDPGSRFVNLIGNKLATSELFASLLGGDNGLKYYFDVYEKQRNNTEVDIEPFQRNIIRSGMAVMKAADSNLKEADLLTWNEIMITTPEVFGEKLDEIGTYTTLEGIKMNMEVPAIMKTGDHRVYISLYQRLARSSGGNRFDIDNDILQAINRRRSAEFAFHRLPDERSSRTDAGSKWSKWLKWFDRFKKY